MSAQGDGRRNPPATNTRTYSLSRASDRVAFWFVLKFRSNVDLEDRHEAWLTSGLNRSSIIKLAAPVIGHNVNKKIAIVIAGAGKIFVGEIVELGS